MKNKKRSTTKKGSPKVQKKAVTVVEPPLDNGLEDAGNGERFVAQHGKQVRHVRKWGKWLVWNGSIWNEEDDGTLQQLAKATATSIYREADSRPVRANAIKAHAKNTLSTMGRKRMLESAAGEAAVLAKPSDFNANPMLFNVQNGTINLRTGKLLKHRRGDFITKIAPVEYDPKARFPMWDEFLERMIPDRHLRDYLQKAAGYTLTGVTSEQVFFFPFGRGASGKGTFLDAINAVMGEYASSTRFETFLDLGRKDYDMWRHARSRMVSAQEVREGQKFDEALVKTITGTDLVTAERKYCDPFQFRPQWKLWLAANSRPEIDAGDSGMWRRVRVIPFTVSLERGQRDPKIRETLKISPEARRAVLAWMVEGCIKWQREGLVEPPAVLAACETYRDASDNFAAFFERAYVIDPSGLVPTAELLAAYRAYCAEMGERRLSDKDFYARLRVRGCEPLNKGTQRAWSGLAVKPVAEVTATVEERLEAPAVDADAEVEWVLETIQAEKEAEREAEEARIAIQEGLQHWQG